MHHDYSGPVLAIDEKEVEHCAINRYRVADGIDRWGAEGFVGWQLAAWIVLRVNRRDGPRERRDNGQ